MSMIIVCDGLRNIYLGIMLHVSKLQKYKNETYKKNRIKIITGNKDFSHFNKMEYQEEVFSKSWAHIHAK